MLPKIVCAVFVCAAALCLAQAGAADVYGPPPPPPAPLIPVLACQEPNYVWGEVLEGDFVEHAFEILNRGGAPLIIESVKTTCGCTSSKSDKEIAPGGKGLVTITLRTRGYRGSLKKTAQIISNDPVHKQYTISLSGEIRPVVKFEPDKPALEGLRGEPLETTVRITRNVLDDIAIVSVKGLPASRVRHEVIETKPGEEFDLKLSLDADEKPTAVSTYDRLTVLVKCGEKTIETAVSLRIKLIDTVTAMPTYITFRAYEIEAYQRNPNSIKPAREVILKSWRNRPFNVTALELKARRFVATPTAQAEEIEPPIAAELQGDPATGECKIRIEPIRFEDEESVGRPIRCELTITTDDPATPRILIPVTVYFPVKNRPATAFPGVGPFAPRVPPANSPVQRPPVAFPRPNATPAQQPKASPATRSSTTAAAPQAAPQVK